MVLQAFFSFKMARPGELKVPEKNSRDLRNVSSARLVALKVNKKQRWCSPVNLSKTSFLLTTVDLKLKGTISHERLKI